MKNPIYFAFPLMFILLLFQSCSKTVDEEIYMEGICEGPSGDTIENQTNLALVLNPDFEEISFIYDNSEEQVLTFDSESQNHYSPWQVLNFQDLDMVEVKTRNAEIEIPINYTFGNGKYIIKLDLVDNNEISAEILNFNSIPCNDIIFP